jgi:two-component system, chemotaxis family, chemotaxis protein CheY
MNILLVDDSRTMRIMQKHALTPIGGVTFFEATDGVEAMKVIAAHPAGFDLIMVDWNMPNMNGLEFITKVRETDRKTPMIMVTTEGDKSKVMNAIQAGVNNFVVKPFSAEGLLGKAQQTLAKAKAA